MRQIKTNQSQPPKTETKENKQKQKTPKEVIFLIIVNGMRTVGCSPPALKISAGNSLFTYATKQTTLPLLEAQIECLSGI